jgi:type IV pilus assembly protein PilM
MWRMGFFGEAGVVGLEMDTGVIRAVELRGKPGKVRLLAAGRVELPESAVVDGVVNDASAAGSALERLWSKSRFSSRDVVVGTYNQGVLMRLVSFPKVPKEKLAQALRLQAGDYFPIPLSQMVLDFAVVGESENKENGLQYDVLLVAARRAQLDNCLDALKYSRLQPKIVDASPLALLRSLAPEKTAGTVVLLDISNGLSSLLLVSKGVPRFARVIPVSLRHYMEALGLVVDETSTVEEREDVAAARQGGGQPLEKWAAELAGEVRSSISYVAKQENWGEVEMILLSGRGARIPNLPVLLADQLGVAVEVVKPLAKVSGVGSSDVNWETEGPDFAVSVGLALRGLEG